MGCCSAKEEPTGEDASESVTPTPEAIEEAAQCIFIELIRFTRCCYPRASVMRDNCCFYYFTDCYYKDHISLTDRPKREPTPEPVESPEPDLTTLTPDSLVIRVLKQLIDASDKFSPYAMDTSLNFILRKLHPAYFKKGELYLKSKAKPNLLTVVESGCLELRSGQTVKDTLVKCDTFGSLEQEDEPVSSAYSVCATEKTIVWFLSWKDYQQIQIDLKEDLIDQTLNAYKGLTPLFADMARDQTFYLMQGITLEKFSKGDVILSKGSSISKFYILKTGKVVAQFQESDNKMINIFTLSTNDFFGHEWLLYHVTLVHYVAQEDTEIYTLPAKMFAKCLSKFKPIIDDLNLKFIRISPFFSRFSPEVKENLAKLCSLEDYEEDQDVITQGEAARYFFVVLFGRFETRVKVGNETVVSHSYREHTAFGEFALFENSRRTATVTAVSRSLAIIVPKDVFLEFFSPYKDALQSNRVENSMQSWKLMEKWKIPHEIRLQLIDRSEYLTISEESPIFSKGDNPSIAFFFIIEKGEFTRIDDDGETPMGLGEYFGHDALTLSAPQQSQVVATADSACTVFQFVEYRQHIQSHLYDITRLKKGKGIGVSPSCIVKLCHFASNQRMKYALKMVRKSVLTPQLEKACYSEKANLMLLHHSFIVPLISVHQDTKYLYFLTGYQSCGDLRSLMTIGRKHRFDPVQVLFLTVSVCLALEHVHSYNILHRDLKPENIYLDSEGYVKLGDFGNSIELEGRSKTIIGTPEYMPPEIWQGKGQDLTGDLWSLGILVFEFFTGRVPFPQTNDGLGEQILKIIDGRVSYDTFIPCDGVDFLKSLLKVNPSHRPQNMGEVLSHEFFKDISLEELQKKNLVSPLVPDKHYIRRFARCFEFKVREIELMEQSVRSDLWLDEFDE